MEKMTAEMALMVASMRASACVGTEDLLRMAAYVTGYIEALAQCGMVDAKDVLTLMEKETKNKHDTN